MVMVDMVIVGTDRVTAQGDVCNKIGTYLKALAARDNNVPFYVALPSPTIDFAVSDGVAEIPIEERTATKFRSISGMTPDGRIETVRVTPANSPVANSAFDVTPARLVTALITERGDRGAQSRCARGGISGARGRGCSAHRGGVTAMAMEMLDSRLPPDLRQSPTALAVARGTQRLLASLGLSCVTELSLPSGRRADLVALGGNGEIWIVEIKSSVADFRADQKWQDYRFHCDRLFFATTVEVPCEIFPPDTGLIVADAFGAHIVCEAPEHRLHASTRKSMMMLFARAAARRLQNLSDPTGPYGDEI